MQAVPVPQRSGFSDGDGFGNPDHAVQHCDGDGRFALLAGQCTGAERGADQLLIPADGGLDSLNAIDKTAGGRLPGQSGRRSGSRPRRR